MKFLLVFGGASAQLARKAHEFQAHDFGLKGDHFCHTIDNTLLLSSSKPCGLNTSDKWLTVWDGAPIGCDVSFSTLMPIKNAHRVIESYITGVRSPKGGRKLSGVFGGATLSGDGTCIIAPDPLSQYSFFHLSMAGSHFISNSLHLIEKACALMGSPTGRDFTAGAYEIAFGAGGWTRTGLAAVHRFPPHHYAHWKRGELRFVPFNEMDAFTGDTNPANYDELLTEAAESLLDEARAMASACAPGNLVSDLSGGKDTRLVLATLMAAGLKDFHVFIGGSPNGDDRNTANRVARALDLKSAQYLSNLATAESVSAKENARRGAYRFMGTSNLCQMAIGSNRLVGVAQIRGGTAEGRIKSFFKRPSRKWPAKTMRNYDRMTGRTLPTRVIERITGFISGVPESTMMTAVVLSRGKKTHHLFRPEFFSAAAASVAGNMGELQNNGVADGKLVDAYYIFDRGWRHCGFPTQVMNDARTVFEPLNNYALLRANMTLPHTERTNAKLTFDLMRKLNVPDLLAIPFEGDSWPGNLLTPTEQTRQQELAQISGKELDKKTILKAVGQSQDMHALGGSAYMTELKPYMLELADGLPLNHSCWDIMQRDRLITEINAGAFTTPRMAQIGIRILHSLIWLNHDESRQPLSEPIQVG